jgi:hypothetical protein
VETLLCDLVPERDAPILRHIPTLKTLNGKPGAEVLGEMNEEPPGKR